MLRAEVAHPLRGVDLAVSLAIAPGECLVLAGRSGAGKTTLLRIVAGLLRPRTGRVALGAETWLDTERGVDVAPEARGCGLLFQDLALFGHLSAWRNVAYGMRSTPRRARRAAAVALLDRFGAGSLADARPRDLSGGERQRVALARALAARPRVLLLDEPLSALDPGLRAAAGRELAELLRGDDLPSVVVTHDFAEAALLGDRIAVLDGGRIVQTGTAAELSSTPASAFVGDFTGASLLAGVATRRGDGLTDVALDGGGTVVSTDVADGRVAVVVHPWEIALERPVPASAQAAGSTRNRLPARVTALTPLGNRVRVGLALPQPLSADVTASAAAGLELAPGAMTTVAFKATATRLLAG